MADQGDTYLSGRIAAGQDPLFIALNSSLPFDRRLWAEDLAGSRAHLAVLAEAGVVDEGERAAIEAGLAAIERELSEGRFPFQEADEDIHMAIERRLIELVGPVGGKLHTGRSRNDQVVTDLTLYVRGRAGEARRLLLSLLAVLLARAREHLDWPLPGYTHLQRAQP